MRISDWSSDVCSSDLPVDLIVGWMVLEHLHQPLAVLRKLRRWIQPDGWLVLSVPDAGSLEFRVFGDRWYALQLPTHLHHFSPETLANMMTAAGWTADRDRKRTRLNSSHSCASRMPSSDWT